LETEVATVVVAVVVAVVVVEVVVEVEAVSADEEVVVVENHLKVND